MVVGLKHYYLKRPNPIKRYSYYSIQPNKPYFLAPYSNNFK
ncbi:hypothetical protein [Helicobacter acinonychis]|nr:hypothetical protein [Helicobacter acinonychis]